MSVVLEAPIRVDDEQDVIPEPWRWTREDYHRALELGFFEEDDKIELIDGEIYPVSPQSRKHYKSIRRVARVLEGVFGSGYTVDQQGPAAMNPRSEPEPDVIVARGDFEDYEDHPGPDDIVLVVEVSDSSLRKDRILKGTNYAGAAIQDYWILNLKDRTLEVRRDPGPQPETPDIPIFRTLTVHAQHETVFALERPGIAIAVKSLFSRS